VDVSRPPPSGAVLGLAGGHQWANAWVARAALRHLPPPFGLAAAGDDVPLSFADARLPGRFDVRGRWIFDVAHNPDGLEMLVAALEERRPTRPVHALVGIRSDKAWRAMLDALAPRVECLVLAVPPSIPAHQRWGRPDLAAWVEQRARHVGRPVDAVFEPDFTRALTLVAEGAGTVLVTGSFHTVGDALGRLPGFAPLG
jgi:dihydrofolate synthase/folylpolyglutamate synthase